MMPRRAGQNDESIDRSGEMAALESARSAAESSADKGKKKDEEHVSLFWRLFGGTILSMVVLGSITLYNHMSSSIAELRNEVSREREARAGLVKKEDVNTRVTNLYERIRGLDPLKVEIQALKERGQTNAAGIEGIKKDTSAAIEAMKKDTSATADAVKKDGVALELLKERVAAVEALKKEVAGLDSFKEKLTAAAADLKAVRDEVTKLTSEVEKNKSADLERKLIRDAQYKQVEDSLKELQKGLQDCREKLARLEGSRPKPGDVPLPFAMPTPTPQGKE